MTNRQVKFSKSNRSQKARQFEKEDESGPAYRGVVLFSPDNVDRMAVTSERARLINRLVKKSEDHYATKEFASCYRGPIGHVGPAFSVTSHANKLPIPKAQQVIPAYPSLVQGPQWYPHTRDDSEQDSLTDFTRSRKYKCRCLDCPSPECPAKNQNKFKPRRMRDNIMTFSDQYTMTCKVLDASCGGTPTPSIHDCNEMSVPCTASTSMVAVRDHKGKLKLYEMYNKHSGIPVPILKKSCTETVNADCSITPCQDEQDGSELFKTISVKCFLKKNTVGTDLKRKNLYNEGISDVAIKFPSSAKLVSRPFPSSICTKATMSDECSDSEANIPHSHRSESKYHKHCVANPPRPDNDDAVLFKHQEQTSAPRAATCKACSTKPCKRCKLQQRTIRLPKKVLMSEKVAGAPKIKPRYNSARK